MHYSTYLYFTQVTDEALRIWVESNCCPLEDGFTWKHKLWSRICSDLHCEEDDKQHVFRKLLHILHELQWKARDTKCRGKKKLVGVVLKGITYRIFYIYCFLLCHNQTKLLKICLGISRVFVSSYTLKNKTESGFDIQNKSISVDSSAYVSVLMWRFRNILIYMTNNKK